MLRTQREGEAATFLSCDEPEDQDRSITELRDEGQPWHTARHCQTVMIVIKTACRSIGIS